MRYRLSTSPLVLLSAVAILGGCIADPMPSPDKTSAAGRTSATPGPDGSQIVVSSASPLTDSESSDVVGVIGLKGAVTAKGIVIIRQAGAGEQTVANSSSRGTFAATIAATVGERLEISFETSASGPESDPIPVVVPPCSDCYGGGQNTATNGDGGTAGGTPQNPPSLKASMPSASAPDGQGQTEVTATGLPVGFAQVGNVYTGEVKTVPIPASGAIDVFLGAGNGDTIVIIVEDPSTGATSQVYSVIVP